MTEQAFDVFLAHSSKDKPLIRQIYLKLKERGIRPWLDEEEIAPGTSFQDEIQQAIGQIKTAAICIGKEGLGPWQSLELKTFINQCVNRKIPLIPVLLPGVEEIPEDLLFLREFHAVAFEQHIEDEEALHRLEWGITGSKPPRSTSTPKSIPPIPPNPPTFLLKELQECDSVKILFIKNVKDPGRWAYSLDRMEHPQSRTFKLWWRSGSHGSKTPLMGDLMILHQRAKVTHIVEFLDAQVHQTDSGLLRWVRAVWMPEQEDWYQLSHQKEILGFNPNYSDGNTHSFNSFNFSTFREAWSDLEEFQKHVFKKLIQSKESTTDEDDLASEKGIDYTHLRDFLTAKQWKEADQETANRMAEALGQQSLVLLGSEAIRNFPITDLLTIDSLWSKYSDGKFGFSIQRRVLNEIFQDSKVTPETCFSDYERPKTIEDLSDRVTERWRTFGEKLGWINQDQRIMMIDYTQEVTNKPDGYLPLLGQSPDFYVVLTSRGIMPWWWLLLLRLEPWEL
ncbi:MAG TPA: GUN4 domain-containing protein [Crinalium sp.]|jgi:hypothetical protein